MTDRALVIASYLLLLIGGYFAVGAIVENEKERALAIERVACHDLREVVKELNGRIEPYEAIRVASLRAVMTAARHATTPEAAARYRRSAADLRRAEFDPVGYPACARGE